MENKIVRRLSATIFYFIFFSVNVFNTVRVTFLTYDLINRTEDCLPKAAKYKVSLIVSKTSAKNNFNNRIARLLSNVLFERCV